MWGRLAACVVGLPTRQRALRARDYSNRENAPGKASAGKGEGKAMGKAPAVRYRAEVG